jgi:hypothetical protein
VRAPGDVSVLDTRIETPDKPSADLIDPVEESGRAQLAELLYSVLHCRRPAEPNEPYADWVGEKAFARRLARANAGRGTWQPGWTVAGISDGQRIAVERYGVRFWTSADAVRTTDGLLAPGTAARVRSSRELRDLLGGFYTALGNADEPEGPGLRVYWHLYPSGAARLVQLLSSHLNDAGIPFWLKVLKDPVHYDRTDSAVLYLHHGAYRESAALLKKTREAIAPYLKAAVSAYVKRLAPGVGIAEDPVPDQSFGQHRSRLLAGLLSSRESVSVGSADERVRVLLEGIAASGLDPERFHLASGSRDDYAVWD